MRLTDDIVRKHPRPAGGQQLIWDELVSGFGVRLTPTKVSFVIQWRDKATGKKPRESLKPAWPTLGVAQAREQARKRLGEVVALEDSGTSEPLRTAMRRWYARQVELDAWRPRYRQKVDGLIAAYIEGIENPRIQLTAAVRKAVESLGAKPVGLVTRPDVLNVVEHIRTGSGDQLMAQVSAFYNWALERGVEVSNPGRNRLKVTGGRRIRSRILTDEEYLKLYRAAEQEGDPASAVFLLLTLTGCRLREITGLRWSEVDLAAGTIVLPAERRKTGKTDPRPFTIILHPLAVELLRRQPVLKGNPYVFWGRKTRTPFEFHQSTMTRLRQAEVADWRMHDLRRFMRSGLARLRITQMVSELCLGHIAKSGLVAVYDAHSYKSEMAEAWQAWGNHVAALIGKQS